MRASSGVCEDCRDAQRNASLARSLLVFDPVVKRGTQRTVGDHMTACPRAIRFDQTLSEAADLMSEHAVRHLPVVKDGAVVGVLSDRDVSAIESLAATPAARVRVVEAMTPVPYAVPANAPLVRVVQRMSAEKYGCAIVTDPTGREAIGIFTTTDALGLLCTLLGESDAAPR